MKNIAIFVFISNVLCASTDVLEAPPQSSIPYSVSAVGVTASVARPFLYPTARQPHDNFYLVISRNGSIPGLTDANGCIIPLGICQVFRFIFQVVTWSIMDCFREIFFSI